MKARRKAGLERDWRQAIAITLAGSEMQKRTPGTPLSEAELRQRREAARARWDRARRTAEGAAAGMVAGGALTARRKTRLERDRRAKIATVMREFKAGTLKMGRSGKKVTDRRQAIAIALAEARRRELPEKPVRPVTAHAEMLKREPGRPLTEREREQRRAAARARWRNHHHAAETTPSFHQAARVREPRRSSGLVQSGRIFDTRTAELGTSVSPYKRLAVRLHVPQAYKEGGPDLPPPKQIKRKGPRWLESYDEAGNRQIARNIGLRDPIMGVPTVPRSEFLEAMRYPKMREIAEATARVLAQTRQPAVDRGYETGAIPPSVDRRVAQRAYNHAAAMAMHKAGLIDYDFELAPETRRAFRPLRRFMLYTSRRVFSELNSPEHGLKGKWGPFREEFGHLYVQRKHGKETGHTRYRMRDNQVFIKVERPEDLEKLLPAAMAAGRGIRSLWRTGRAAWRAGRAAAKARPGRLGLRVGLVALSPFTTAGVMLGRRLGRTRTAAAAGGVAGFGLDLGGAATIIGALRDRYAPRRSAGDTTRYLRRYLKIDQAGLAVLRKVERPVHPITAALRRRALALAKRERLYGEGALLGGAAGMYAGMGLSQRLRNRAPETRGQGMRVWRAGARLKQRLNVRRPDLSRPLRVVRNTLVNIGAGRKAIASWLSGMRAKRDLRLVQPIGPGGPVRRMARGPSGRAMLAGSLAGAGLGALMARERP
jgi:hypothetical protein